MTIEVLPDLAALTSDDVNRHPWEPFGDMPGVHIKYLFRTANSVAGLMRMDARAAEPPHVHVSGQHHVWVTEGVVHFDGTWLDAGGYLHVPPGMMHTMQAGKQGCTLFFVYMRRESPRDSADSSLKR